MASEPPAAKPPESAAPATPPPPPPPGPDASREEWHAWRRRQRDYERSQWARGGWYGPGWGRFGWGWFWGAALVLLGVYFLLGNLGLLSWLRGDIVWPVLLILFGVALIVGRGRWWR